LNPLGSPLWLTYKDSPFLAPLPPDALESALWSAEIDYLLVKTTQLQYFKYFAHPNLNSTPLSKSGEGQGVRSKISV
jgi:hypothetical protein